MVVGSPTKLNLIPSGVMPVVYINQGDAGYDKEFLVYNGGNPYNVPAGVSATIRGKKADGYGVTEAAALTEGSNLVTVTITEQMVAAAGANLYELVFVDTDGLRIATVNMVWVVKPDALGDSVISDSDLDYATTVMNQLQSVQAFKRKLDTVADNLTSETDTREAADATLQANINTETSARVAADTTLQNNINAEAATRSVTDASLQSQINQLVAPSGTAPSAAEVENARIGANGTTYSTLGDAIRSQASDNRAFITGLESTLRMDAKNPSQTVNGYITTAGNWNSSTDYVIKKYEVIEGNVIYIQAEKLNEAVYQFQDSNSIPHSSNTHIVGTTVLTTTAGYITVPTGATWILITDRANGTNGVYEINIEKVFDITDSFQLEANIPGEFDSQIDQCSISLSDLTGKKVFISNKNLLPQFAALTDHGVTCTQNADGSITLSGTASATASFQLSGNVMPNVGPGTYTLSAGNPSAIGDNVTYINPAINGSYSSIACRLNSADAETTFTLSEGQYISAIRIRISSGVTLPDNYTLYPQLEVGEEKTAFVAHEGYTYTPTEANYSARCLVGYNYICAQANTSGTVTYYFNAPKTIGELDTRVTDLENRPSVTKKFAGKKIVCFGDSITGNYQPPTDYPSMIAGITGATVYNAGFGGCCMSDNGQTRRLFTMCRLVDSIVAGDFSPQENSGVSITYGGTSINYVPERIAMLESIDWSDIDYITIAYGTNDWNSNYALDNENDPDDTSTYIGAFRYSVEKLLTAYPNIKILAITPLWRWWDTNTGMPSEIHSDYIDSNDYHKGTGYYLWNYGDALIEAAKEYQIPSFDLYHNCMMNKYNRFEYFETNDGTHPKSEGRVLMAGMISAKLESTY